jgi:hypothetical protein
MAVPAPKNLPVTGEPATGCTNHVAPPLILSIKSGGSRPVKLLPAAMQIAVAPLPVQFTAASEPAAGSPGTDCIAQVAPPFVLSAKMGAPPLV